MKANAINSTKSKKNPNGNKFCKKCGTFTIRNNKCNNIEHDIRR